MIRHAKLVLAALLVVFSASTLVEAAAPHKIVHRRPKHSTRVSSGVAASRTRAGGARKRTARKKARASASRSTAKKPAAKSHASTTRRRPATKPQ
jgi:hypothetical protein